MTVTIPGHQRRAVAEAMVNEARAQEGRAAELRAGHPTRVKLLAEAAELRKLADSIQP